MKAFPTSWSGSMYSPKHTPASRSNTSPTSTCVDKLIRRLRPVAIMTPSRAMSSHQYPQARPGQSTTKPTSRTQHRLLDQSPRSIGPRSNSQRSAAAIHYFLRAGDWSRRQCHVGFVVCGIRRSVLTGRAGGEEALMKNSIKQLLIWFLAVLMAWPWPLHLAAQGTGTEFNAGEIEQLVAPIALYPDSLVSQILMASTYPLEVVQADRWAKANKTLKGEALTKALEAQDWDPSVKSLVNFPQVLAMMSEKLDVTQKLGDAFLAQQKDVLDAIQRLRAKAQAQGNLKTTKEQTVIVEQPAAQTTVVEQPAAQTTVVEQPAAQTTIIKIEPTNPQVVYVPTYNPTVVYGAWPYPAYPPYTY